MTAQQLPTWMTYLQILNFCLTWGTALYVFIAGRRGAFKKRIEGIEGRLQKLENTVKNPPSDPRWEEMGKKLVKIEAAIENPPADPRWEKVDKQLAEIEIAVKTRGVCSSHERMEQNDTKLFERLDKLHGEMKEMTGGVKGITASVDLITQHLISKG